MGVKKFLVSLHKIFVQAPGRCTDYKNVANDIDKEFSVQFVSLRWVENKQVSKKAIALWPKVKTVIDYCKVLPKSKQPGSERPEANVSYNSICGRITAIFFFTNPSFLLKFFDYAFQACLSLLSSHV